MDTNPGKGVTKVIVNLPNADVNYLTLTAAWKGESVTQTLIGCIATDRMLRQAIERGQRILLADKDGKPIKELVPTVNEWGNQHE